MADEKKLLKIGEHIEKSVEQAYFDKDALGEYDPDNRIDILCGDNFEDINLSFMVLVHDWKLTVEWFYDGVSTEADEKINTNNGVRKVESPVEAIAVISEVVSLWEDGKGYK